MSNEIWFDPTSDKWALSDGEHYLEVPYWARGVIADEFERETEPLKTENARLREQGERLFDKTLELATENDKLRELVQDMVLNMGGCALHGNPLRLREFGNRAKELGVEA